MATVNIALQNQTSSSTVYAYITGRALDNNNALFLLQSDGKTYYYPTSPSSTGSSLSQDCAIPLGAPGKTTIVTVPHLAGSRIWFSVDGTLTFLLNPGPALVEPSVTNPSDPNINLSWDFCEFTFNAAELFVNISYVDFVYLPISLALTNTSDTTQYVSGTASNGLDIVCEGLRAQTTSDGAGWSSLIVPNPSGGNLRALSPNNGITLNPTLFNTYYQSYVNQVWSKYTTQQLSIDTQATWGTVPGHVDASSSLLDFGLGLTFTQPSSADIFSCSTGPFDIIGSNIELGALIARLSAAFNRSTLLIRPPRRRASYVLPYDDVAPTNGVNQSGAVQDASPKLLTVAVGGGNASSGLTKQQ